MNPDIYTSTSKYFKTSYRDIIQQLGVYIPYKEVYFDEFSYGPKKYYQNQLSFYLWLATTRYGISKEMLLSDNNMLLQLVLKFHAYYQTKRFLNKLKVPLPNGPYFNPKNNYANPTVYEPLCSEFNISKSDSFKIEIDHLIPIEILFKKLPLNNNEMKQFIIDQSNGLTEPGIRYLNDSIRTYSWLILRSQAQTSITIIRFGKELDAQHQYLKNLEAAIARAEDLSKSISDYQDTLKYARSKLGYVITYGCYMCPSNMNLNIGSVNDYNNLIQEATDNMKIGLNSNINTNKNNRIQTNTQTKSSIQTDIKRTNINSNIQSNTYNTNIQQPNINSNIQTNTNNTNSQQTTKMNSKNLIMATSFSIIALPYSIFLIFFLSYLNS